MSETHGRFGYGAVQVQFISTLLYLLDGGDLNVALCLAGALKIRDTLKRESIVFFRE